MSDEARWFDSMGNCQDCKKPANGVVRGPRNEAMGRYCIQCGHRRVNAANKERERASRQSTGDT